jgi:hypothetical protein
MNQRHKQQVTKRGSDTMTRRDKVSRSWSPQSNRCLCARIRQPCIGMSINNARKHTCGARLRDCRRRCTGKPSGTDSTGQIGTERCPIPNRTGLRAHNRIQTLISSRAWPTRIKRCRASCSCNNINKVPICIIRHTSVRQPLRYTHRQDRRYSSTHNHHYCKIRLCTKQLSRQQPGTRFQPDREDTKPNKSQRGIALPQKSHR